MIAPARRPALSASRQNAVILVVLLTAQLFLMSGSVKGAEGSTGLETAMMRISSPVVTLAQVVSSGVSGLSGGVAELWMARRRNQELEAEIGKLADEAVRLREAGQENQRLRRLLGMRQELAPRSVAASVVTSHLNGQTRMVVLDRGRQDGIRAEHPVVAWGGAVGRVVVAGKHHSKVRLLTDASSGVAVLVQRSRTQGIVVGRAGGALDLLYIPRFSDVMHGDRVVTSGLDGIFPRGFGVGQISSISEAPDGTQTIHLEPELDYSSLEEVLIVLESTSGGLLDFEEIE